MTRHPGAESFLPVDRTIDAMAEAVQACHGCDLYQNATQAVFGDGPPDARLVVVGEQPGDAEDRAGEPFVGPAGRLLDRGMEAAGIDRREVYITNAVKHFRFTAQRGKRRIHQSPTASQITACRPWLVSEVAELRPEGVLVLGATAGRAVLGPRFRVQADRGRRLPSPLDHADWVVATVHPSSVLRSDRREKAFEEMVADLAAVRSALD